METAIIIGAIWIASGLAAWGACLADFYSVGKQFPGLGTADEQWNGTSPILHGLGVRMPDRYRALPVALMCAVFGPVGLLVAVVVTKCFKTGFRFW